MPLFQKCKAASAALSTSSARALYCTRALCMVCVVENKIKKSSNRTPDPTHHKRWRPIGVNSLMWARDPIAGRVPRADADALPRAAVAHARGRTSRKKQSTDDDAAIRTTSVRPPPRRPRSAKTSRPGPGTGDACALSAARGSHAPAAGRPDRLAAYARRTSPRGPARPARRSKHQPARRPCRGRLGRPPRPPVGPWGAASDAQRVLGVKVRQNGF